jgi:NAD(P)-dependent dehydrogenase (short-subunit alcohol dehydrogenase family)
MEGQRVVVVGGTSGMGLATVRATAALGAVDPITFVTGGAVVRPPAHGSMIAAAFAAVEALTRALAIELGARRVNTIRPGYTDSDMWSFLADTERDELRRRVAEAMPVKRMGTPDDIAQAAVFVMTNPQ